MTTRGGPARVDAVLQGVLQKHGVDKQVERFGVIELWPEIVGQQLAEVTRVKGVEDAVLFVEVRSSAWLTELSMMKEAFVERVNARLERAPIERIVFVLAETT
jgi:predicted nucleic acid-binding Zn ribbon protein